MVSPPRDSSIGPVSPAKKEASRLTAEKGVILEIDHGRAVLLTRGGRFVGVPVRASSWAIGQEVAFTEADAGASAAVRAAEARTRTSWAPRRAAFAWTRLRMAAIAAVLALVLTAPGLYLYANRPLPALAYVSVDINPGVDLGVDARGRVVTADATNQDGQTVLAKAQVLRLELEQALKNLTGAALQAGFLNEKNSLVIVAAVPFKAGEPLPPTLNRTLEKAKTGTQTYLGQQNVGAVVQTIVTDEATREEAKSHNMSVGKYAIYLVAKNEGLPITVQDLQKGLGQAIKNAGGQVGEIAGKAHERTDYKELGEKFKQNIEEEEKEGAEKAEKGKTEGQGSVTATGQEEPAGTTGEGKKTGSEGKENEGKNTGSEGKGNEGKETEKEHEGDEGEPEGKGGTQPNGTGQPMPGGTSPTSPSSPGETNPNPGQTPSPGQGGALDKPKTGRIAYETKRPNEPDRSFGLFSLEGPRAVKDKAPVKRLEREREQTYGRALSAPEGP